jgi:hypothetical protein
MINDRVIYCNCMEEIKKRIMSINAIRSKKLSTLYSATNIEFICLQTRKILELIALSSISANKEEYARQYEKFASHWNAKRILSDIEKVNPSFYPVPTIQIFDKETGRPTSIKKVESGYLTKEEFPDVYDKCSEVLHSSNPYGIRIKYGEFEKLIPEWQSKIMRLLNFHVIQLIDSKLQLWVLMHTEKDRKVHAYLFECIS